MESILLIVICVCVIFMLALNLYQSYELQRLRSLIMATEQEILDALAAQNDLITEIGNDIDILMELVSQPQPDLNAIKTAVEAAGVRIADAAAKFTPEA